MCLCARLASAEGGWFYCSSTAGWEGNEAQWRHAAEEKEQEVGNTLKSERAGRASGEGQCVGVGVECSVVCHSPVNALSVHKSLKVYSNALWDVWDFQCCLVTLESTVEDLSSDMTLQAFGRAVSVWCLCCCGGGDGWFWSGGWGTLSHNNRYCVFTAAVSTVI